ncbi:extracellular protein, partial [Tuber indicum]
MHTLSTLLLLLPLASAHMDLKYPAPLNHPNNPNTNPGTADFSYNSPISAAQFPCKGHHKLLGTPAGKSVATWAAGSTQNFTLSGTAVHGGGSCQASISEDGGKTFRVVRSYVGGCPAVGKAFEFVVPKEAKSGVALFAWTWFNNLGNREMYMNCAAVTISDGGSKGLSDLPEIFQANLGSGCETVPGSDVLFPTPGNDAVIVNPAATAPVGACG